MLKLTMLAAIVFVATAAHAEQTTRNLYDAHLVGLQQNIALLRHHVLRVNSRALPAAGPSPQRTAQVVLDGDRLRLHQLAMDQQHPQFLTA